MQLLWGFSYSTSAVLWLFPTIFLSKRHAQYVMPWLGWNPISQFSWTIVSYLPRDAMLLQYILWPYLCLCLSQARVLSKRLTIPTHQIAPMLHHSLGTLLLWRQRVHKIQLGSPPTWATNTGGVGKTWLSTRSSLYLGNDTRLGRNLCKRWRGNFEGEVATHEYRHTLPWTVQKRLCWQRCSLIYAESGWSREPCIRCGCRCPTVTGTFGVSGGLTSIVKCMGKRMSCAKT